MGGGPLTESLHYKALSDTAIGTPLRKIILDEDNDLKALYQILKLKQDKKYDQYFYYYDIQIISPNDDLENDPQGKALLEQKQDAQKCCLENVH